MYLSHSPLYCCSNIRFRCLSVLSSIVTVREPPGPCPLVFTWIRYSIDFGKCNFCRLCEEACPTKPRAVWHSLDYEVVFTKRDEMVRCWKKDFPFAGKYWDLKAKDFLEPEGQIHIHDVEPRRN